jgi:nicotinate-nucleotide adenylyltransferase
MRIAVFPGSFNPLHIGHQAIMEHLTHDADFDWVYLIVSPKNPLKQSVQASTGRMRYESAVAAVKRHPELHVWVDDIELRMEPPYYTIRTLEALKKREPENDFTLIMGADNLAGLRRWFEYKRILLEFGVGVYPREGVDEKVVRDSLLEENPSYKIELFTAPEVDISSTLIRNALAEGKDMSGFLM